MDEPPAPKLILVHGAWHGSWCWGPLESRLRERGVDVVSVELTSQGYDASSLGDLYRDAEVVRASASASPAPTVLLGHSYGGLVIYQAAQTLNNVSRLIYLAAFLPEPGDSLMAIVDPWIAAGSDVSWLQTTPDGLFTIAPGKEREFFYHDCEPAVAAEAAGRLRPQSADSFRQPVSPATQDGPPSVYVVCTEDSVILPQGQRLMARRADHVVELSAGHSPFLSHPGPLCNLVLEQLAGGSAAGFFRLK